MNALNDRILGISDAIAVKIPVYISPDENVTLFGLQSVTETILTSRTITITDGMRLLLRNQNDKKQNGIWIAKSDVWIRSKDFNGSRDIANGIIIPEINGIIWQLYCDDNAVIGTNELTFKITQNLVSGAIPFVADISAVDASVYTDGMVLFTTSISGDYTKSGLFKYQSSSIAIADKINTITPSSGSGKFTRMFDLNGTLVESLRTAIPVRNYKELAKNAPFDVSEFLCSGETTYDAAFKDALDAAAEYKNRVVFGPGTFDFSEPFSYEMPTSGLDISGHGVGRSILNFPNAAEGEVELYLYSAGDWYDLSLSKMSIKSSHAGTLLKLGKDDYSDPLNVAHISDLAVLNSKADNDAIALYMNYVVNSVLTNVRANCSADGNGKNYGKALLCRQVEFTHFDGGSYGNSSYGISFEDGYSMGDVFTAIDNENTNIGIYNGSANSGLHTFIGGQFSLWQQYLLQAPVGIDRNRIHLIRPNLSSTTNVIDTANCIGIEISGIQTLISTPSIPSSSTTYRNTTGHTVQVAVWGGTVSAISINSYGIGVSSGTFILRPGETIAITYTASPSWYWYSIN